MTKKSPARKTIHSIVDELPETELAAAKRYLEYLHDFGHSEPDPAIEKAWAVELRRRLDNVDAGRSRAEPWPAVKERLAKKLGFA